MTRDVHVSNQLGLRDKEDLPVLQLPGKDQLLAVSKHYREMSYPFI